MPWTVSYMDDKEAAAGLGALFGDEKEDAVKARKTQFAVIHKWTRAELERQFLEMRDTTHDLERAHRTAIDHGVGLKIETERLQGHLDTARAVAMRLEMRFKTLEETIQKRQFALVGTMEDLVNAGNLFALEAIKQIAVSLLELGNLRLLIKKLKEK